MTRTILDDVRDIISGVTCDRCGATASRATLLRFRGRVDGEQHHICAACVSAFVKLLLARPMGVEA